MASETLQLNFSRIHRPNHRRVRYPILQAIGRLVLLVVALAVLIALLMKLGLVEDPEKEMVIVGMLDLLPKALLA